MHKFQLKTLLKDARESVRRTLRQSVRQTLRESVRQTLPRITSFIRWRLNWSKRDLEAEPPRGLDSRFRSARKAIELIPDRAVIASSGFAGCGICSLLFWALRNSYGKYQTPRDLTLISVGAQGGRGKVPGTVEELAAPGLLSLYIAGHLETAKALLKLGQQGLLEIHTLPQGVIARLFSLQGKNSYHLHSSTGLETFLDPRYGQGSIVTTRSSQQLVKAEGKAA